jgi:hypothetical protein
MNTLTLTVNFSRDSDNLTWIARVPNFPLNKFRGRGNTQAHALRALLRRISGVVNNSIVLAALLDPDANDTTYERLRREHITTVAKKRLQAKGE